MTTESLAPPSPAKLLFEPLGFLEIPRLLLHLQQLNEVPKGEGQTILVIPGYATDDPSTFVLRKYLNSIGYRAHGWGLGRNNGEVEELLLKIKEVTLKKADQIEDKIILIGWSLGGYIAREVARELPDIVKQVITFGSPVIGGPKYTAAAKHFKNKGIDLDTLEEEVKARESIPIKVPVTAIYSKTDGVVAWQACIDHHNPNVTHYEVKSTHLGLGFSADVFKIIASSLARNN